MTEALRLPGLAGETTAFLEQNGELILEAESGTPTEGTTHLWVEQTIQSGFGGDGYVRTLPDIGQRYTASELGHAPQLSFDVGVSNPGNYTLWVRGMAADGGSDSLHVSLDGAHQAEVSGFGREWSWSKVNLAGTDTQLNLDSGLHDLTLQMREDGLRIDAVVATDDPNFVPSGAVASTSPTGTVQTNNLSRHTIDYEYDDLYRLTNATYTGDVNASYVYEYDRVGNMAAYTETVEASRKRLRGPLMRITSSLMRR